MSEIPSGPSYLKLTCDHFASKEAVLRDRAFRPKGMDAHCGTCGKWRKFVPLAPRVETPEQPMF